MTNFLDGLYYTVSEKKTSVKPFGGIFAFIRHCSEGKSGKQERKWGKTSTGKSYFGVEPGPLH